MRIYEMYQSSTWYGSETINTDTKKTKRILSIEMFNWSQNNKPYYLNYIKIRDICLYNTYNKFEVQEVCFFLSISSGLTFRFERILRVFPVIESNIKYLRVRRGMESPRDFWVNKGGRRLVGFRRGHRSVIGPRRQWGVLGPRRCWGVVSVNKWGVVGAHRRRGIVSEGLACGEVGYLGN